MRKFDGNGTWHLEGIGDVDGEFQILFEENGRTSLILVPNVFSRVLSAVLEQFSQRDEQLVGNFLGTVNNPSGKIEAEQVYLNKFGLGIAHLPVGVELEFRIFNLFIIDFNNIEPEDEVEIRYGLTNFLFFGREITERNGQFTRDTIRFNVEGLEIALIQRPNYRDIEQQLRAGADVKITSEMMLRAVYKELSQIDEVAHNLRNLYSLATGNYVTDMYQDIYKEGKLVKTILKPSKTYPFTLQMSAIDSSISGDSELETFLTISYPEFTKYKEELGLEIVIEYYITSRTVIPLEAKYILGVVGFECIESYLSECFRAKGLQRDLSNFKKKTISLFDEFGLSYEESDLDFIDVRDRLVHTGRFPKGVDSLQEYLNLINLMHKILLTIVGYKGNRYFNVSNNAKETLN